MEQDGRALRMASISGKSSMAMGTHSILYICLGILSPAVRAEARPEFWAFSPAVGLPTPPHRTLESNDLALEWAFVLLQAF